MSLGSWLTKKLSNYLMKEVQPRKSYLSDFDRVCHEIIPCDVLLVEGRHRVSKYIKRIVQSPWTHAALYIGRLHSIEDPAMRDRIRQFYHGPPEKQLIIDSQLGRGTMVLPIQNLKGEHIRICRPRGISHTDAQLVIDYAINQLGKKYNIRHFLDLWRFLMESKFIPKRLGSSLFRERSDEVSQEICSTMIAKAFMSVGFPILPLIRHVKDNKIEYIKRNPKLFVPSDFDYSPYFEIIKYPMYLTHYRDLPWNNEDTWTDDLETVTEVKKKVRPKKSPEVKSES